MMTSFGSLRAAVMSGKRARHHGKDVEKALGMVSSVLRQISAEPLAARKLLPPLDNLKDHFKARLAEMPIEEFHVVFAGPDNRLICAERMWSGTVDETPCYPREIFHRALNLGATQLVFVHNHPSGRSEPSEGDIRLTRRLFSIARGLGITIRDHLIVTRTDVLSMREKGLI